MSTVTTAQQYRSNRRTLSAPAAWTTKAIRPTQLQQILSAGLLTPEADIELLQVPRIVFHPRILGICGLVSQADTHLLRFLPRSCCALHSRERNSPRKQTAPHLHRPAAACSRHHDNIHIEMVFNYELTQSQLPSETGVVDLVWGLAGPRCLPECTTPPTFQFPSTTSPTPSSGTRTTIPIGSNIVATERRWPTSSATKPRAARYRQPRRSGLSVGKLGRCASGRRLPGH